MSIAAPPSQTQEKTIESRESRKAKAPTYGQAPGRFHFLLRRLHSFMGLLFGGYIAVHLIVNASGVTPRNYQLNVDKIHNMEPMLPFIELAVIFIPLLIHALYGIYITWAGVKFNTMKYSYGGNIRYTLQRWTAVFLLLFIAFHIGTLHKWGFAGIHRVLEHVDPVPTGDKLKHYPLTDKEHPGAIDFSNFDLIQRFSFWCDDHGGQFGPHNEAYQTTVNGLRNFINKEDVQKDIEDWKEKVASEPVKNKDLPPPGLTFPNMIVVLAYLLGIWSATFHFANGLWTSAIAWGLTVTAKSQKRWGHVCLTIGILLTLVGTTAWYAFTLSPNARGDTNRWNDITHTLPDEDTTHEEAQPPEQQAAEPTQPVAPAASSATTKP